MAKTAQAGTPLTRYGSRVPTISPAVAISTAPAASWPAA
jgi:hypothetical protein